MPHYTILDMEIYSMQKEHTQSSIEFEIMEKLLDYPVYKKAKTEIPLLNVGFLILFIIMAHISLLINEDGFSTGFFEAAQKLTWWNIVLAVFSIVGLVFFIKKTAATPLDINSELKSDSLKEVLQVSKYNANVKSYIKSRDILNKRDYHFLNIHEQLNIISNTERMYELKQILKSKPEALSERLENKLKTIQVKPFVSQTDIMIKVKNLNKKGFVCLGLIIGIVAVASLVNMQFTPTIRGSLILICFAIAIPMFFFFLKSGSLNNKVTMSIGDKDYIAVKKLCRYSESCRLYISSVLQEGRVLNEHDLDALSVYQQLEMIEYINVIDHQA